MRKFVIVISLIFLFLFGCICGFSVAVKIVKNSLDENYVVQSRMKEEANRLKLTSEQIEKAAPGYEKFKQQLKSVKRDTMLAIARAAVEHSTSLADILDAKQSEEFKKLNEERRLKFEKMVKQ